MKYAFAPDSKKVLESLSFTKTLYAFDFDGTLSPIVPSPEKARMSGRTAALLEALSKHAPVAIISGRASQDLRERLDFCPPYLIGNHGIEGLPSRPIVTQKARKTCDIWKEQLKSGWGELEADSGVFIEDKAFSIALHFRLSRRKKRAKASLARLIRKLEPQPRVVPGKCVFNLLPLGAPHKGMALLELMKTINSKCALYIGDDDTDEDVFGLSDAQVVTIRVAKKNKSQAQYYLNRQAEVDRLLKEILKCFNGGTSR